MALSLNLLETKPEALFWVSLKDGTSGHHCLHSHSPRGWFNSVKTIFSSMLQVNVIKDLCFSTENSDSLDEE